MGGKREFNEPQRRRGRGGGKEEGGGKLIDTPAGDKIPLSQISTIKYGTEPNTINRENVSRLIVVTANAKGRDLRSVVNEIKAKVQQQVQISSSDYYIQYAG